MNTLNFKRGDTVSFIIRRKNEDGSPRTGDVDKLRAQIRNNKEVLIGSFLVTESVPGDYLFQIEASVTKDWIPGAYVCDVEFKDGSFVQSTATFQIVIEKDVTRDG